MGLKTFFFIKSRGEIEEIPKNNVWSLDQK